MNNWQEYKEKIINDVVNVSEYIEVTQEQFNETVLSYIGAALRQDKFPRWADRENQIFMEGAEASRYSIEVNYRTTMKDAQEGFAKICLGYVSAAMKAHGFHVKLLFSEKPVRILVSSRNWDDGEWVGMITFNSEHNCFILAKGFYNRDRKTVSVQSHEKCKGDSGAELVGDMRNLMHNLKNTPDRHREKLKPVALRPGKRPS